MAQYTTNYNALVSLLGTYVEDSSTEFSQNVLGCVNRAEDRCLRDLDLEIFNTVLSTTTSNGGSSINKSVTESPVHNIYNSTSLAHIERRSYEYIQSFGGSGVPAYYSDDTSKIYFAPVPDNAYAIIITQVVRPQPLNTNNTTNWLTNNVADLLLWASLIECEEFLIAPERAQEFQQNYAACLGPLRAFWRESDEKSYEPVNPTPTPQQTR